jgi:hypothetical protein
VGLLLRAPGSGPVQGVLDLIDSSFYEVYTDPSKPPGIGNLAALVPNPRRVVALTLPPQAGTRRTLRRDHEHRDRPPPQLRSLRAHDNGFSDASKDVMGMLPRQLGTARNHWSKVLWRPWYPATRQRQLHSDTTLLSTSQSPASSRATQVSHNRASGSIQRTLFVPGQPANVGAFRRWMLPTVERGPPVLHSV